MERSADGRSVRAPRSRIRSGVRTATLLCAAAALVTAVVPASAQTRTAPDRAPAPVVVVDCFSEAQVKPEEYLLACGDGNNRLVDLRWDTWGAQDATATGTDMVNDCTPIARRAASGPTR